MENLESPGTKMVRNRSASCELRMRTTNRKYPATEWDEKMIEDRTAKCNFTVFRTAIHYLSEGRHASSVDGAKMAGSTVLALTITRRTRHMAKISDIDWTSQKMYKK